MTNNQSLSAPRVQLLPSDNADVFYFYVYLFIRKGIYIATFDLRASVTGVGISDTGKSASCPTAELQRLIAMPLARAACLYQEQPARLRLYRHLQALSGGIKIPIYQDSTEAGGGNRPENDVQCAFLQRWDSAIEFNWLRCT